MQVLKDVTGEEFVAFIGMLAAMESMQTLKGRQDLVNIVTDQADLDQPFEVCCVHHWKALGSVNQQG